MTFATRGTPRVGSIGFNLNLLVRQGANLGPVRVKLTNPDGTPVNLAGSALRGQVRKTFTGPVLAEFTVAVPDPPSGEVLLDLPPAVTAGLPAGADYTSPTSQHVYDVEMEDSVGTVLPVLWGQLLVHPEVTRVV